MFLLITLFACSVDLVPDTTDGATSCTDNVVSVSVRNNATDLSAPSTWTTVSWECVYTDEDGSPLIYRIYDDSENVYTAAIPAGHSDDFTVTLPEVDICDTAWKVDVMVDAYSSVEEASESNNKVEFECADSD